MTRKAWIGFFALLAFAALLRVVFFTGLVGGDEIVYSKSAALYLDGFCHIYNVHQTRTAFLLPIVLFYAIFGIGEIPLVLYNLLCGLGLTAAAFFLARRLFGERAGFAAMAVAAFHPTLVYYSTECHTDLCVAFWQAAAVLALLKASDGSRPVRWMMLAGLLVGWAWMHKASAIFIVPLFAVHGFATRRRWTFYLPAALSALGVLLAELTMFTLVTGNPLERLEQIEAWHQGYMQDQYQTAGALAWRFLLELPAKLFFLPGHHGQAVPHLAGLLAGIVLLIRRTPGAGFLAAWFAFLYAFISFWPSSLSPLLPGYSLYGWTFPVFALPLGCMLGGLLAPRDRPSRPVATTILGIFCIFAVGTEHHAGRKEKLGPMETHAWLEQREIRSVVTDAKTIEILDLLDGHRPRRRYVPFEKAGDFDVEVVIRDLFWTTPGQWYSQPYVPPPDGFRQVHRSNRIEIWRR